MQLNGAEIVIECLKEQGVDTVFGYPGGAILRQCQSSGGKSDPKGKPSGDPDGKQVNIPVLIITAMQRRRGDTAAY